MTTDFAWPTTSEPPMPARPPRAGLRSPRSWAELLYAVVDLAPAIAFFVLIVTLLSVGIGLAVIYVGVLILALGLLAARFGGLVQRALALALLDLPTAAPAWAAPHRPGPISALAAVLRDPANWRATAYFVIKIVLAPVTFGIAVGMYGYGLGAISYSLWRPCLPEVMASDGTLHRGEQWWPDFFVDGWLSMTVLALLGLGVLWCAPRAVSFLTTFDRILIGSLLSAKPDA
jgi:hypothetical protein